MAAKRELVVLDRQRIHDVGIAAEELPTQRQAGHTGFGGQRRERPRIERTRGVEVQRPLVGRDVLRHFHFTHEVRANRPQRCRRPIEHVTGFRQELPGRARVADLVGPFAKESDPAAAHVQPRTHPVAVGRRGRDRHRLR